ncbi:type II secretion system protein [Vibrio rotiferianus]|jgi:prepilin-type N-terminal cleavage/methylation domain-containing protein|uniref:type II secretion system protein n=1 Tax=Vibrio rotiferianus TaxID=190895 RepID=UPI0009E39A15|nr:type II secretion system protein [Vibrio rotiferianus]
MVLALKRSRAYRGFTMIEMIVVMALMAAASTIVVPQLWGQYTSLTQQKVIEQFWSQIHKQALASREHGENFVFQSSDAKWQQLAQDNELELEESSVVIVRADGFTQGGVINLKVLKGDDRWGINISTPDGDVKIARQ